MKSVTKIHHSIILQIYARSWRGWRGSVYVSFFLSKGLKGFFPSPLFFFRSIITFASCFITHCMLSISMGSLSFFSDSDLDIPFPFIPFFSYVEALFSSFPGWLEIYATYLSTLIASWKFSTKVCFYFLLQT